MRLLVFCEAPADFRTTCAVIDRVLQDEGPPWVAELLPEHPEAIRTWVLDDEGRDFFDLHKLDAYRRRLGNVRFAHGHFDGKPGESGAQMARNALLIGRGYEHRDPAADVDAVILVWDMDDQGEARRKGLAQARTEASGWASFKIVLGCPDPMREAWVLASFEPVSEEERARLDEERRALGFHPCEEAHRLVAKSEQAKLHLKRVVRAVLGEDLEREGLGWSKAPLDRLKARGVGSGLHAFLGEVKAYLVPLCGAPERG